MQIRADVGHDVAGLSYIAGFFDGEGSVVITPNGASGLELNVCIVNTDRAVLAMIHGALGARGGIHSRPRNGSLGKREVFALQYSGAAAEQVLRLLYPYLRVKKGKAEVALRFRETFSRKYCGVGVPVAVRQRRESLRQELKSNSDSQSIVAAAQALAATEEASQGDR